MLIYDWHQEVLFWMIVVMAGLGIILVTTFLWDMMRGRGGW